MGWPVHETLAYAGRHLMWAANTKDLPEPTNRVTQSGEESDGDGIPAPKVEYTISENTRRMLKFNLARMEQAHDAAGAVRRNSTEVWVDQPGHLLGTARMGDDPATSVVDRFGRAHDVANLFIVDGSTFVTGGGVNPTATITALALRPPHRRDGRRSVACSMSTPVELKRVTVLTARHWHTLLAVADALIPAPADQGAPSALDGFDQWLQRALDARPDLAAALLPTLVQLADSVDRGSPAELFAVLTPMGVTPSP